MLDKLYSYSLNLYLCTDCIRNVRLQSKELSLPYLKTIIGMTVVVEYAMQ